MLKGAKYDHNTKGKSGKINKEGRDRTCHC
jgi:hypothetical protein